MYDLCYWDAYLSDDRGNSARFTETEDIFTMGSRSNFRVTAKYFTVGFYRDALYATSFGQMGFSRLFRGLGDISGDKYSAFCGPVYAPCAALPPGSRDTK